MQVDSRLKAIYAVRKLVPPPLWRRLTAPYWWWYNRARHQVARLFDSRLRASQTQLADLQNTHLGERCFIIGNGPSLQRTDLRRLKNEVTFGLNRIYLMFDELGFETSYFVAINTLVIEQCAQEILGLAMPKFLTWRGRRWIPARDPVWFLDTDYTPPETFSTRITGRVFEGSTVTFVAMQVAYHLGFQEVVLVGVDHSFSSSGQPNATVTAQGADLDHFSPDYFSDGFRWQLPDLAASERAYRLARYAFEADGRRILDATVGGKLEVFPKVDYVQLFD